MRELKIPLDFTDQIIRLVEIHNLKIEDPQKAITILKKVNYYRLSGYGIGLTKNKEEYKDGLKLDDLYSLYVFDTKLRNILIHVIEYIEVNFRSEISYLLALKYGADGYMDPSNFVCSKEQHEALLSKFNKETKRQKNIPFVKHHKDNYGNKFPIWVAVELFTFGSLSRLFSYLRKEDQKLICKNYDTDPKYLNGWIQCIVEVRNICAHFNRLYNLPLKQIPALYKENRKYLNINGKHKVFPVLLVIKRLLNSDENWNDFLTKLKQIIDEHKNVVNLSFIDFPQNWEEVLSSHKNTR